LLRSQGVTYKIAILLQLIFIFIEINRVRNLKLLVTIIICLTVKSATSQICSQPGALLSVRNSYRSHVEYLIFTFVDPYNYKGDLTTTSTASFSQIPLFNTTKLKGHHFYKINFTNTSALCDTKNYIVVPQNKIMDFESLQRGQGIISYVIGLAKGAKITSHTAYNYHSFHIVKLRIE